ncbi:MAG: hypothetical protein Q9174_004227 [Haloplaca sp. 1 TL-2023]
MPRTIQTLPLEVQRLIFEHILHPGDLKALCLVSKKVSAVATEILYRHLVLPYDENDRHWKRLARLSESRGLQYVRTIDTGFSEVFQHGFCKPVGQVITKLPPNSLTRFHFGSLGRPLPEDLRHLWHTQKNLTNFQLDFSLNAPTVDEIVYEEAATIHSLQMVSELEINFGSDATTTPEMYDRLGSLLHFSKLRKVTVLHPALDNEAKPAFMDPVLHHLLPYTLTHLSFSYISLSPEVELQLDSCRTLRHLELRECAALEGILRSYCLPTITSFTVQTTQEDGDSPPGYMAAVVSFLQRCRSLRRLIADIHLDHFHTGSVKAAIENNSESLEALFINVRKWDDGKPMCIGVECICSKLSQLVLYAGEQPCPEKCEVSSLKPIYAHAQG